ncbi:acyl-CoA dehydrogenase family protein [Streptomyces sp. NRRL S-244]|uniref:acyl-CoA dehydrogenase family protein n=1 Tax=Streptomyces sp. NRRL S-244 TaxID=1463897 RepID=UPI0004BFC43F|nr:acyl-CoA dehydrogenase family protein [Streptomyces sp. NRRL S-244]
MVTGTGLVERAGGLGELGRRRAADAEEQRRLTPDVVALMLESGFARHFVPVRLGGVEGGFSEFARAVATVAEGCAATAWCASVAASLARVATCLPEEGQADVWGGGADVFVVGSLSPVGKAVPAPGGWRVSGSWAYISGVDYSDWVVVCAVLPGGGGARLFALPRGAYAVKDTWTGSGMRGTGSNTVIVDDVFVPESRSADRQRLSDGHTVPIQAVNGLSCAPAALGAARGALKLWTSDTAQRLARGGGRVGGPGPALSTYEAVLTRSSGEIDAAMLLLERAASVADRGPRISEEEIARNVRDYALSTELLVSAVNRMFSASGTSGQSTGSPLERAWRDVNSIATHIALTFDPAAVLFASRPFALEAA